MLMIRGTKQIVIIQIDGNNENNVRNSYNVGYDNKKALPI